MARSATTTAENARVFIALCPEAALRQRLVAEAARLHKILGGRITRAETVHLTLVFIGDLQRSRLDALAESLRAIALRQFQVVFDRAECWRRNRIAFLAPSRPPDALFRLVENLEQALDRQAVAFDRRPYAPHITLLRQANCKERAAMTTAPALDDPAWSLGPPIVWPVESFVLMESTLGPGGAEHRVLERFELARSEEDVAFQVSR